MPSPVLTEVIFGLGHENIQATHHSTVEFTKDKHLTRNGDCILIVAADKGLADLDAQFRAALQKPHAKLTIKIEAADVSEEIHAEGSPKLALTHPVEMVLRKSDFASDRTLGVHADKAAKDLSRKLVEKLKNPHQKAKITLTIHF
ncbi:MAG: DUF371 domain-containing protein [Candidatus Bathyarchaeota archaeon]|nr:DUF371 domain-containing protein [Candidatus Bathyarchaeota archaeon]